jgi:predicted DNA-binding transcriptional regulator YafY
MRADRLLNIMLLLRSHGKMTSQALADELEVSQRTILRDIDALSVAGVPIYTDGGHHGGITLDANYRVTLTGLKDDEVRALFISGSTQLLSELGLGDAADSTLLKLFAALPTLHQSSVEHIRQRIYIDPIWWWSDSEPLSLLGQFQEAVYEDRVIQTVYQNYSGEIVERTLEPYSLVAKSSFWYLIAKREGELRTYRVSRFHEVKLLDEHFQRDPAFDLPTYWQDHLEEFTSALSEYNFTLRVHSSRVSFARWLTPGRCEIIEPENAEGWTMARFHMESMDLAKMLVFGLGKQGVVVEPQTLREAVIQTACELIQDQPCGW